MTMVCLLVSCHFVWHTLLWNKFSGGLQVFSIDIATIIMNIVTVIDLVSIDLVTIRTSAMPTWELASCVATSTRELDREPNGRVP